jgi:hypothetical protein
VTKEAQTRLLPYAAIGTGVSGEPWAEKWINSRAEELGREPDPFLPAFSCKTGRWSTTPMSLGIVIKNISEKMCFLLIFLIFKIVF